MSQQVIVLDEAEDELIEAQKWYESQRSGLAIGANAVSAK
jgi:hypothetical protein